MTVPQPGEAGPPPPLRGVAEIARAAGALLVDLFRDPLPVRTKKGLSLVTEADEASERAIRERLAGLFPGEPVLGEEGGLPDDPSGAWWVVDPLDGTTNFVAGLPLFCVAVARMEEGRATHAVIHDPVSDETFSALRGAGAFLGDERLAIAEPREGIPPLVSLRASLVAEAPSLLESLGADKLRCLGSAALDLAYIAAGRLHGVVVRKVCLWDVAAGALIVEEAGGSVRRFEGGPLYPLPLPAREYVERRVPIIAGTPLVAARLERALRG